MKRHRPRERNDDRAQDWNSEERLAVFYWNELDKGGHFAAFEQPEAFIAEVRAAFGAFRR